MKTFIAAFLVILVGFGTPAQTSDVESVVAALKKAAKPGAGITQGEQEIAKKVQSMGPKAIPYLLPLLRDQNEDVRDLVSFTLRNIDGLTEQHLGALIESRRRGDGWIPLAIARIGTPEAVKFLIEELVRERQTQTQLTHAIGSLGEKGVPGLLAVYENDKEWDTNLENTMCSVFKELGNKAAGAIDPLLKIACDERAPRVRRVRAVITLGAIGLPAERAVPRLQKLRQGSDVKLRTAATAAIEQIGSPEAVPLLVKKLEAKSDILVLRDIARLGTRGRSAGPVLLKFLEDKDWDMRAGAVRTLGYIGYDESADDLVKMLGCVEDWRVALSAAESLGRFKAPQVVPAVSRISKAHWYPPVREAAARAIEAIRTGKAVESRYSSENLPFEFFAYEHVGEKMESVDPKEAEKLNFPIEQTPEQTLMVPIKGKRGSIQKELRKGVKVEDGFLVGSNHGEWGGEVTFIDVRGDSHAIVAENTEAIYQTGDITLAVTGLAHLSSNWGTVYKLARNSKGKWIATKWRTLPGAPLCSRLLKDGNLWVSCYGGIVTISPTGQMRSLTRSECF